MQRPMRPWYERPRRLRAAEAQAGVASAAAARRAAFAGEAGVGRIIAARDPDREGDGGRYGCAEQHGEEHVLPSPGQPRSLIELAPGLTAKPRRASAVEVEIDGAVGVSAAIAGVHGHSPFAWWHDRRLPAGRP